MQNNHAGGKTGYSFGEEIPFAEPTWYQGGHVHSMPISIN
jgi:hypothetical protein